MGDLCINHNVKLLTYGTLVRSKYYLQFRMLQKSRILTSNSAVAFWQKNGLKNWSLTSMVLKSLLVKER